MPVPHFDPSSLLEFAHLLENLKTFKRRGWLKKGIPSEYVESIADHMYRMAILIMAVKDASLDMNKCIRMALVHDMAEAITTDLIPEDAFTPEQKQGLESEAMDRIEALLIGNEFGIEARQLWTEYSSDSTAEAQFVKDMDKLELLIQVREYEKTHGIDCSEWIQGASTKIRHPQLQQVRDKLLFK